MAAVQRDGAGAKLWESRPLRAACRAVESTSGPLEGWRLALAYGDARGEADRLVENALRASPYDPKALFGRAIVRRMQGRPEDAIADAEQAWN